MIFKPYYYFQTGCAAYLFGCGSLGMCAVVDAHVEDIEAYAEFAASTVRGPCERRSSSSSRLGADTALPSRASCS
jgi:hypothetical protein